MTEACDEGLGMPVAERRMIDEPFPDRRPAGGFHAFGVERRLVDEDQPLGGQVRLGLEPAPPPAQNIRPLLLGCVRGFF